MRANPETARQACAHHHRPIKAGRMAIAFAGVPFRQQQIHVAKVDFVTTIIYRDALQ
jgi:hypothetical protein